MCSTTTDLVCTPCGALGAPCVCTLPGLLDGVPFTGHPAVCVTMQGRGEALASRGGSSVRLDETVGGFRSRLRRKSVSAGKPCPGTTGQPPVNHTNAHLHYAYCQKCLMPETGAVPSSPPSSAACRSCRCRTARRPTAAFRYSRWQLRPAATLLPLFHGKTTPRLAQAKRICCPAPV